MKTNLLTNFAKNNLSSEFRNLQMKYDGPKFDSHTHVWDIKTFNNHKKYFQAFNIKKILAIINFDDISSLNPDLKEDVTFARFFFGEDVLHNSPEKMKKIIDEYYSHEYDVIKFWFAPRWKDYVSDPKDIELSNIKISDYYFDPLFSRIEELGLTLLIHNSDPDLFYQKVYQPESKYGKKLEHINNFEKVLEKYPKLKILGAHFGAQPENLENLARWFDKFPNYYVDLSSARWMARELSKSPHKSINFLTKYQNRILWGTDLSFGHQKDREIPHYYFTRYLTYQALLESNAIDLKLPFPDPENEKGTVINGLNLPKKILENIYWKTPLKFFNVN